MKKNIKAVIDTILSEGSAFLNENGFYDKSYIMERFSLTEKEYREILSWL